MATDTVNASTPARTELRTPRRPSPKPWLVRTRSRWLPYVTVIAILLIWEILGQSMHWNPLFSSYPSEIWGGFVDLAHGTLWTDLQVSGAEFILGMLISLAIAIPVGLLMGMNRTLYAAFDPIIGALYSTPILVLAPLLVIWFGLGIASKVAIVVILSSFSVMMNLTEGVRSADPVLLRAARSFGANRWQVYTDVVFPAVVPFFVTGLRLAVGRAMIGVVVGEYIASTAGVGYQINADAELFNTPRYLAGAAVVVIISVAIMAGLKYLEKTLAPWRRATAYSNE
jgi:NitT/TauT family transport system permease protein